MANTTAEILSVNGTVLNTLAKNIESITGRWRAPGKRTQNAVVAGRHGSIRTSQRLFTENILALPMWVVGGDDDGAVPAGSTARRQLMANIDELTRLFLGGSGALDVRHTQPDGSIRQCFADVLDAIDFTTYATPLAKFGVTLVMDDPFWRDLNQITQQVQADGATASFSSFAGATAPMEHLRFKFTGPWNSPVLTFADGSWLAYDGNIAAGGAVYLNCDTWNFWAEGTAATPILANIRKGGVASGRWAAVPPSAGAVVVNLAGTARTTATQLEIQGRRAFLVG